MSGAPRALLVATVVLVAALVVSAIHPHDRTTWFLEVVPVMIALPLMWATWKRFPLTNLLYILVIAHCLVLIVGGAYTYARVPIGFTIQELLGGSRNPYDKIGHFMQGFVPAILAREILLRGGYVARAHAKMLAFIVICIPLAFSAFYELMEWWTALALGQGSDDFLGTQGDPWDTQSDMFMALIGASAAVLFLSRPHDRQIELMRARGVLPA
jgi:putative membrane protein